MVAASPKSEAGPVTEVSVMDTKGIPADSMLSIRAGGFRRHRLLSKCSEPFVFRGAASAAQPLQVDVLVPAASSGLLSNCSAGQHRLELHPLGKGTGTSVDEMHVTLEVREALGAAIAETPTAAAQQYLDEHMLKDRLTHALMQLLRERPTDPLRFLSNALCGGAGSLDASGSETQVPLLGSQSKFALSSELASLRGGDDHGMIRESVHMLPPCVSRDAPTRLLDLGSSETGFYVYEMVDARLTVKSSKRTEPFFASFVEPWCVGAFCDALIEEFKLQPDIKEVSVYAGATGLHRDLLMSKRHGSEKAKRFVQEAQQALSERLGGKPAKIWLFVPSGLLEAQLELYATEWLVGRASLFDPNRTSVATQDLPKVLMHDAFHKLDKTGSGALTKEDLELLRADSPQVGRSEAVAGIANKLAGSHDWSSNKGDITFDEFESTFKSSEGFQMAVQALVFSGTLSAGGGSCQMAMMSESSMPSLQLFTAPVGNRVPIIEGEFSKPVLPAERETWRARIRAELGRANFPRGVRGLYIGISAAYYAVKAAGLADRLVGRNATVAALEAALEKLDPEDQRAVANLTLVHELLQWVFHEAALFVFKRNWKIDGDEMIATWTLGLFLQQHQAMMSEQAVHRRIPKRAAKTRVQPPSSSLKDGPGISNADKLFEVPFVAWPLVPSYLLDIGSGELGLYVYEADLVRKHVKATRHTKIADPFYEGFVVKKRVEDFATIVMREFGIEPGQGSRHEVIAGGTTGLHREILLSDQAKRDEIFSFVKDVEAEMSRQLGRQTVIRIFVPSGELEAQFELRGVQWLIGQASIDVQSGIVDSWMVETAFGYLLVADGTVSNRLPPQVAADTEIDCIRSRVRALGISEDEAHVALRRDDSDRLLDYNEFYLAVCDESSLQALVRRCCFCGTISCGSGSSQLSLTGCMRNSMAQMFSMPIGNRLPITQRMFSTPVTWEERGEWVERIRDALRSSQFPQGVSGLFVGISAMYHAAKLSGVAERIVSKQEAMKAFADTLAKLEASDHRNIANLTLAQEITRWVFDNQRSCFLFKRNWSIDGVSYVAGWTLGWYVTQFEADTEVREKSVCDIQRISRGARVRQRLQHLDAQSKA